MDMLTPHTLRRLADASPETGWADVIFYFLRQPLAAQGKELFRFNSSSALVLDSYK
jgi:hypothetical protein